MWFLKSILLCLCVSSWCQSSVSKCYTWFIFWSPSLNPSSVFILIIFSSMLKYAQDSCLFPPRCLVTLASESLSEQLTSS